MSKTRTYVIAADPGPNARREHKKARTRNDLIDAAVHLFGEKGFAATTVEDIAAAARVSPRTFFRYFATKEEILFPRKDQELASLEAALAARPPDEPPLESMRAIVVEYVESFQAEKDFHLLRIDLIRESWSLEAYGLQLHQQWIRALARVLARRMHVDLATDLRPVLLAGCSIMIIRALLVPWMHAKGDIDIGALADEAFDHMQMGFRD
jgi:AcrR family transcriptional regulator